MQVKIKKLNEKAILPSYATDGSAGLDITAISEKITTEGGIHYIEYGTGLALELPHGYCGLLMPRSSVSNKTSLVLSNCVGLLDSDFRGEITFRFKPIVMAQAKKYNVGDKIGQLVIVPYPRIEWQETDTLTETERGSGGYGSTTDNAQKKK